VHDELSIAMCSSLARVVVTSLPGRIANPLLEHLTVRHLFREIVNASSCVSRRPSPGPLVFALSRIGVEGGRDVHFLSTVQSIRRRLTLRQSEDGRRFAARLGQMLTAGSA
jgi:beta-phosphoglucomutase-like phosphatase (HAD superfamily)